MVNIICRICLMAFSDISSVVVLVQISPRYHFVQVSGGLAMTEVSAIYQTFIGTCTLMEV